MHSLVVSVLPAPLSPEMSTDCADRVCIITLYAECAIRKMCGGNSSFFPTCVIELMYSASQLASGLYGLVVMRMGPIAVNMSSSS